MLAQVLTVDVDVGHQKRRAEANEHAFVFPIGGDVERADIPRRAAIVPLFEAGVGSLAALAVQGVPAVRDDDGLPLLRQGDIGCGVVLEKLPAVGQADRLALRAHVDGG